MTTKAFKPSHKYPLKLRLVSTIVAIGVMLGGVLLAIPIGIEEGAGAGLLTVAIVFGLNALWWVPAMLLAGPYYHSLSYEIQDDQVVMHVGIWTKAVKHVPYRTVTNLTVKQGMLDRLFGLGTLDIQTAGMSGTNSAEQSLAGLDNAQEVYELVAAELRRFRGGMEPTAAAIEGDGSAQTGDVTLAHVLEELRAIRRAVEGDVSPTE